MVCIFSIKSGIFCADKFFLRSVFNLICVFHTERFSKGWLTFVNSQSFRRAFERFFLRKVISALYIALVQLHIFLKLAILSMVFVVVLFNTRSPSIVTQKLISLFVNTKKYLPRASKLSLLSCKYFCFIFLGTVRSFCCYWLLFCQAVIASVLNSDEFLFYFQFYIKILFNFFILKFISNNFLYHFILNFSSKLYYYFF